METLYSFNEIYYRATGEFGNAIQILFLESAGTDLLVYDHGSFCRVNRPPQLNLEGFERYFKDGSQLYRVMRIVEKDLKETYVELEDGAILRIGWRFSTKDGQVVENVWILSKDRDRANYDQARQEMESPRTEEIIDQFFCIYRKSPSLGRRREKDVSYI